MSEGLPTVADTMRPEPLVTASPLLIYQGQPISREMAVEALASFDADKDKVAAALAGDTAKQQERRDLWMLAKGRQPGAIPAAPLDEGAVAQTMQERDQQIHEAKLDVFAKFTRQTPEMRAQYSRRLATAEQHSYAVAERARLLKDGAFRAKVLANDADAVARWVGIVQVAAAPVAPPDFNWNSQ